MPVRTSRVGSCSPWPSARRERVGRRSRREHSGSRVSLEGTNQLRGRDPAHLPCPPLRPDAELSHGGRQGERAARAPCGVEGSASVRGGLLGDGPGCTSRDRGALVSGLPDRSTLRGRDHHVRGGDVHCQSRARGDQHHVRCLHLRARRLLLAGGRRQGLRRRRRVQRRREQQRQRRQRKRHVVRAADVRSSGRRRRVKLRGPRPVLSTRGRREAVRRRRRLHGLHRE
jgi:hypothetical protein